MFEDFNATVCVHVDKSLPISTYKYCLVCLHIKTVGLSCLRNITSHSKISLCEVLPPNNSIAGSLQNKICTTPICFFFEEEDAGSCPVWIEPSFMQTEGIETFVGENEWGEQGKDNGRRCWRVHGYYLCPYTSREQEIPNPSFPPPLCHTLFSSQGVILRSRQCSMSESCHWNHHLSLPSLLPVCSCPATSPLQTLARDHLFSNQLSELIWLQMDPFFAPLFTTFFGIFFHANLHELD